MIYYRLAFPKSLTERLRWKTTILTSLQAVLTWLRIYGLFALDQMYVFSSYSKEGLEEMLQWENSGLPSGAVTAEQFLRERRMHVPKRPEASAASIPDKKAADMLDRSRWETERGPGGDHDVPYSFSFPADMHVLLAWIRLQKRARAEALQQ